MLLALDCNNSCIRAVRGLAGDYPLVLPLEPPREELPLAVHWDLKTPRIGSAALAVNRREVFHVHQGFLPRIPADASRKKRPDDTTRSLLAVWEKLRLSVEPEDHVLLGLPGYLDHPQVEQIRLLAQRAGLPVLGTVSLSLAPALAGFLEHAWYESALLVDIDDHALNLGLVRALDGQAHLLELRNFPSLGLRAWRQRLVNALADCIILQSRRDPRAAPLTEQALYDQIDPLLESCQQEKPFHLQVQGGTWFQNLYLQPEQVIAFCGTLLRQCLAEIRELWFGLGQGEVPRALVATWPISRLPGLVPILRLQVEAWQEPSPDPDAQPAKKPLTIVEDFGDSLVEEAKDHFSCLTVLGPDALARALHGLGKAFLEGKLGGHVEYMAPLPMPLASDMGPPRLQFQGRSYLLNSPNFLLGTQASCDLVLDSQRHPSVEGRHCEIHHDRRSYRLFNRGRDGTLVNDTIIHDSTLLDPGDWIRLGPEGPLLRFLGKVNQPAPLTA